MRRIFVVSIAALAVVLAPVAAAAGEKEKTENAGPEIEGSYKLVKRVLPDGSEVTPPDIVGFSTWTGKYRNFNVHWQDDEGEPVSIAMIAKYTLSPTEYCETVKYWLANNLEGTGISYEAPEAKETCSKVSVDGEKIRIDLQGEPPYLVFEGDEMVATAEEAFVDHWKRVD